MSRFLLHNFITIILLMHACMKLLFYNSIYIFLYNYFNTIHPSINENWIVSKRKVSNIQVQFSRMKINWILYHKDSVTLSCSNNNNEESDQHSDMLIIFPIFSTRRMLDEYRGAFLENAFRPSHRDRNRTYPYDTHTYILLASWTLVIQTLSSQKLPISREIGESGEDTTKGKG